MKRMLTALALAGAFLLAPMSRAQTTTVTASNIADVGGNPVTGSFCVTPAQQFVRGGGGNVVTTQVCYSITAGVLQSGVTLADISLTDPVNVCYRVVIENSYSEPVASYACMQPSGETYSFDQFVQVSPPPSVTAWTAPQFSTNGTPNTIQTNLNITGPGVTYSGGAVYISGGGGGGTSSISMNGTVLSSSTAATLTMNGESL